jgi:hypothetical protein
MTLSARSDSVAAGATRAGECIETLNASYKLTSVSQVNVVAARVDGSVGNGVAADVASGYPPALTTLARVSQVRVVTSLPNVFSIRLMKTGPLGLGT